MIEKLLSVLKGKYTEREYPALTAQMNRWADEKPLKNIRVLDGTPVFANTLLKYASLLAGGAELTVGYSDQIPYDPEIICFLQESGIPCLKSSGTIQEFDVILQNYQFYFHLFLHKFRLVTNMLEARAN